MAVKDMGVSVLARIKKQSKETGLNYQSCLQLFAQEEFLQLRTTVRERYIRNPEMRIWKKILMMFCC